MVFPLPDGGMPVAPPAGRLLWKGKGNLIVEWWKSNNALRNVEGQENPIIQAKRVYETEDCLRTFNEDLRSHLLHGYVFSTDKMFLMGRPVDRFADRDFILNPDYRFKEPNAWLVWMGCGDISQFFLFEPYPLGFIGWERNNVLQWYDAQKVKRHVARCSKITGLRGQVL